MGQVVSAIRDFHEKNFHKTESKEHQSKDYNGRKKKKEKRERFLGGNNSSLRYINEKY